MQKNLDRYIVLNERTIVLALIWGVCGHPPYVLAVIPSLRPCNAIFERLYTKMIRRGWVQSAYQGADSIPVHDQFPGDAIFRCYHPGIEGPVAKMAEAAKGDPCLAPYAYAFRKCCTDYTQSMINLVGAVSWLRSSRPIDTKPWRLIGAPSHFACVWRLSTGEDPGQWLRSGPCGRLWLNGLTALLLLIGLAVWTFARVRIRVEPLHFRLALDRISPIDMTVAQVVEDPSQVLLVERNRAAVVSMISGGEPYLRVTRDDARFSVSLGFKCLVKAFIELLSCLRLFGMQDGALFGRFAVQICKRVVFIGFFNRFRPRYFWGRDDYSMDHIVRNQEARKIGATTLGVNHGLPINTYVSQWREVDFDIYYVFGSYLYETFYKQVWPAHMAVKVAGNMQLTPERRQRLEEPRSKDIAVYAIVVPDFVGFLSQVEAVARYFPDRRVHVRMKPGREEFYQETYKKWLETAPDNIINNIDKDSYELMLKTSYSISCGSTTGAETIQFGATSFVLDLEPRYKYFYYRNFKGIIAFSAEDIIQAIVDIETGYRVPGNPECGELIARASTDFYAILKADVGTE